MNTAGEERAKKILKAWQDAKKIKLREKILKFILLVAGMFALICAVRAESGIALVLSVMAIINVAMKY